MRSRVVRLSAAIGLFGLVACVRAPVEQRSGQLAMDTSAVRRLCAEPDSVMAGRGTCLLRDQAAVFVREARQP